MTKKKKFRTSLITTEISEKFITSFSLIFNIGTNSNFETMNSNFATLKYETNIDIILDNDIRRVPF